MDLKIGQIIEGLAKRDAIHVAVLPVTASSSLEPGQKVDLRATRDGFMSASVFAGTAGIGVVDPYLQKMVLPGEQFWLFLYPKSITDLRHNWSHVNIPDDKEANDLVDDHERECREEGCWK